MSKQFNAIKHGLLSRKVNILPGESKYGFRKLKQTILDQYQPESDIEAALVDYLTLCFWRLKRALRLESQILSEIEKQWTSYCEGEHSTLSPLNHVELEKIDQIMRYIGTIQRGIFRTTQELERLRAQKKHEIR